MKLLFNNFLKKYNDIEVLIKGHKKYIRSTQTKQILRNLYEKEWLPYSLNFKSRFGQEDYNAIESALKSIYLLSKKDFIEKNKIKNLLNSASPALEGIKLNLIRDFGFIIEESQKERIIKTLKQFNFSETIIYIENAEKDLRSNKPKPACSNARHAVDEFFRNFREMLFKKKISGVTASEHIAVINNKLNMPSSELALLKNGLYVFLSHKGGHGTTDKPSPEDAKLSIDLIYILFGYILDKYGKCLNKALSLDSRSFSDFDLEKLLAVGNKK